MRTEHFQRLCSMCQRQTMHVRTAGDEWLGIGVFLGLSIVSCGLLAPVGLLLWLMLRPKPRCYTCGTPN